MLTVKNMSTISKHSGLLSDVSDADDKSSLSIAPGVTKKRDKRDKSMDKSLPPTPASVSFPDPHVASIQKHIDNLPHTSQLISFLSTIVDQLKEDKPPSPARKK